MAHIAINEIPYTENETSGRFKSDRAGTRTLREHHVHCDVVEARRTFYYDL